MRSVLQLLSGPKVERPERMSLDPFLTGLDWADLEATWMLLASPANQPLVPEFVGALWKVSIFLPERQLFHQVLEATIHLAKPEACLPELRRTRRPRKAQPPSTGPPPDQAQSGRRS